MAKQFSPFKFGFKTALGAYLGWQVAQGIDQAVATTLKSPTNRLISKMNEAVAKKS